MKSLFVFCIVFGGMLGLFSSNVIAEETVTQDKAVQSDSTIVRGTTVEVTPEWRERRTVVPYYPRPYRPRHTPSIQRMPYPSTDYNGTYHFLPHIYIGPNQGGGFGSHFGLRLGNPFLGSHGFQFGINLY